VGRDLAEHRQAELAEVLGADDPRPQRVRALAVDSTAVACSSGENTTSGSSGPCRTIRWANRFATGATACASVDDALILMRRASGSVSMATSQGEFWSASGSAAWTAA
jgi:hypothetical protein